MKKNLFALVALGASVALLAGCGMTTPEVEETTGAVVEETTTIETPEVEEITGAVVEETTTETTEVTAE